MGCRLSGGGADRCVQLCGNLQGVVGRHDAGLGLDDLVRQGGSSWTSQSSACGSYRILQGRDRHSPHPSRRRCVPAGHRADRAPYRFPRSRSACRVRRVAVPLASAATVPDQTAPSTASNPPATKPHIAADCTVRFGAIRLLTSADGGRRVGYALRREWLARQWHARGQGFKSPQLHQAQRIFHSRSDRRLPATAANYAAWLLERAASQG
jgi:hypothetical protein